MHEVQALVNHLHIEDLRNRQHPSVFDSKEAYDMLIIRLPLIKEEIESISLGFIFTGTKSYQYDIQRDSLEEMDQQFEGPHLIIDTLLDDLLKSFGRYQEQVSDMEESLYTDDIETGFMTKWLGLKRDVLKIERIMLRTLNAMQAMVDHYRLVEGFPLHDYEDIHEHCERVLRSASLQLSKLDYLYNFYNARTNEKMNRLIFILTIISAIFLPLNLVVGFFGMNTSGLPFTSGSYGTLSVITGLGFLMIVTSVIVLMWRRRIEHSR